MAESIKNSVQGAQEEIKEDLKASEPINHTSTGMPFDPKKDNKSREEENKPKVKAYRLCYIILATFLYSLMRYDNKIFSEYHEMINDLRENEPTVSAILVDKRDHRQGDPTYLLRMKEGHTTTVDDVLVRCDEKLKNTIAVITDPKYRILIHQSMIFPLPTYIRKYLEVTK